MRLPAIAELLGRILLAAIFLVSGAAKIATPAAMVGMMQAAGVPPTLALPAGVFEVAGGLALILGWQTRIVAVLLAGFCLVAGVLFHMQPADQMQMIMFMKNVALAGGFLVLAYQGAGPISLDARRARR